MSTMSKVLLAGGVAVVLAGGVLWLNSNTGALAPAGDEVAANNANIGKTTGPIPDFSSGGRAWDQDNPGGDNTGFNPIPGDASTSLILHHPDWPYKQNVVNRVGDFTSPLLQPWAAKVLEERARKVMAGGIPFIPNSRCWPGGVPGMHFFPAAIWLVQTEKEVWLLSGRGEVRRIFMDVPHTANLAPSWYGESVGWYENGDTLVVDTIGQDDKGPLDRYNIPHSKQIHVVERFTMKPDKSEMIVTLMVEDPGAFTAPLKGQIRYVPGTQRGSTVPVDWEEYVCNENSEEFFIPEDQLVPVPQATKRDF